MSMPDVVIGREAFSRRLAEDLECRYREFRHEYHPDGEPAPRIMADYDTVEDKHVVLVLRGSQLPDYTRISRNMHNFSRHVGNLSYVYGAKTVDVLMPYLWLGRQDKDPKNDDDPMVRERDQGRDVGFEWLARDFKAQGANRIITLNPHFHRNDTPINIEGLDVIPLSGVPALARYAKKLYKDGLMTDDHCLAGPDLGSDPLLQEFSELTGKDFRLLEKSRTDGEIVRGNSTLDAEGRDVLMIDDIFATLGTIESGIDNIENCGNVDCFGVHGVFPREGFDRANILKRKNVRRFVTTDTIDTDYSKASVIPEIVDFYRNNG
jgi:phosphoribosylpyrophosphate synthetase